MGKVENQGNSLASIFRDVPPLEFEGKEYPIGPESIKVMRLFESWLWKRDLRVLQACSDVLGYFDYQSQLANWRKSCGAGDYAWDSFISVASRQQDDGVKYLAFLRISEGVELKQKSDPKFRAPIVTEELIERIWSDGKKREELLGLMQMASDPNPSCPPSEEPVVGQ